MFFYRSLVVGFLLLCLTHTAQAQRRTSVIFTLFYPKTVARSLEAYLHVNDFVRELPRPQFAAFDRYVLHQNWTSDVLVAGNTYHYTFQLRWEEEARVAHVKYHVALQVDDNTVWATLERWTNGRWEVVRRQDWTGRGPFAMRIDLLP